MVIALAFILSYVTIISDLLPFRGGYNSLVINPLIELFRGLRKEGRVYSCA